MILSIPPRTGGPVIHWHRMHDETFLVLKGTVRFTVEEEGDGGRKKRDVDAKTGDYVVVPVRAVHTFSSMPPPPG